MVRKLELLGIFAAALILGSCRSRWETDALARISEARKRLAALAPLAQAGFGRDAIDQARRRLLEAEGAVRRDQNLREELLESALDTVEIAEWVVERQRTAERREAEAWIESAERAVTKARGSGMVGVHYAVETRLRRAEAALAEAERLVQSGELSMASERAREAAGLAGELPPETRALFERFGDPSNLGEWREWVTRAVRESARTGRPALVVDKRAQLAVLWMEGRPVRWLDVELGYNGLERKLRSGDGATPEGLYRVTRRKAPGETQYYKALLLSYPNEQDVRRFREAKSNGDIAKSASIGGLIEIHGEGGRGRNWTDGCVAVANEEMDYLFDQLAVGSPVAIVGSAEGTAVSRTGARIEE